MKTTNIIFLTIASIFLTGCGGSPDTSSSTDQEETTQIITKNLSIQTIDDSQADTGLLQGAFDEIVVKSITPFNSGITSINNNKLLFIPNNNYSGTASIVYETFRGKEVIQKGTISIVVKSYQDIHTGSLVLSGENKAGGILRATDKIIDRDGISNSTYIWNVGEIKTENQGSTYTVKEQDEGKSIYVSKKYIDGQDGQYKEVKSNSISIQEVVSTGGTIEIVGSFMYEEVLTIKDNVYDSRGINNNTYSWEIDNVVMPGSNTYKVKVEDLGKTIKVSKTYTNDNNKQQSIQSNNYTIESLFVSKNDSVEMNEDNSFVLDALENDTNAEGSQVVISQVSSTDIVVILEGNNVKITPEANINGSFTVNYHLENKGLVSNTATIEITINPLNDESTGDLGIYGEATINNTLYVTDTIEDIDGISNSTYIWKLDGLEVATGVSQYTITETEKSNIEVIKRYDDQTGQREVSSIKSIIYPLELPTLPFTNIVEAPTYEVADLEASNDFYQVDTIYNVAMEEYVLPKEVSGNFIEWSSNDRRVNFTRETNEGNQVIVFSHPANFDGDKNITLTAKYDNNVEQKTENVSITLKAKTRSKVKVLVIRVRYIGIDGESRVATSDDFFSKEEHYSGRNRLMRLSAGAVEIENYNDQIETGESSKTGWFIENETKNDGMIVLRVPEELAPINLTGRQDLSANHIAFYKIIDDIVDFKSLDLNNDGYVERSEFQLVLVDGNQVRSGSAASAGYTRVLDFTTGWSIPEYDGIKVKAGTFNLSTSDTSTAQSSGSTIAHEFGHSLFTLADLYISDEGMTDSYNSFTNLSMMSAFSTGEELGNGSPMTASKIALGFIDPIISTEYSRRTKNELDIENYTEFVPAVIIKGNELSSIKKGGKYLIAEIRGNCKATPGDTRIDESILIEGCKERTGDLYYKDRTTPTSSDSTIVINGVAFTKVNLSNARGDSGRQTRFSASNRINTSIKRLFRDEEYKQGSDSYGSSMEITLFQEGDRITSKTKHYNTNAGSTTEYTVEELGFTVPDIKKNSITSFTLTVISE